MFNDDINPEETIESEATSPEDVELAIEKRKSAIREIDRLIKRANDDIF